VENATSGPEWILSPASAVSPSGEAGGVVEATTVDGRLDFCSHLPTRQRGRPVFALADAVTPAAGGREREPRGLDRGGHRVQGVLSHRLRTTKLSPFADSDTTSTPSLVDQIESPSRGSHVRMGSMKPLWYAMTTS
jgi:hypothetical protein